MDQNNLLKEKFRQACLAMMHLMVDLGKTCHFEGLVLTTDKKRLVDTSWNQIAKILSSPGKIIQGLRSLKEYILQSAIKPFLLNISKTHLLEAQNQSFSTNSSDIMIKDLNKLLDFL